MRFFSLFTTAAVFTGSMTLLSVGPVQAQSCGQLWYQRNAIYADAGYCFKTPRARAEFGENCFAPYGRLTPRQQARVNAIQQQEDLRGCPR